MLGLKMRLPERKHDCDAPVQRGQRISHHEQVAVEDEKVQRPDHLISGHKVQESGSVEQEDQSVDADKDSDQGIQQAQALRQKKCLG